ncbi:MAG: 50S ribosomal protein L28 [Elusimicrobiales bacterium]|nr:50S ribosomal protein L28 [Elusimicrobiales bacterium]HOL62035.1 50S ribosomal protein L28 [Elusimicrobiales bacterium]HPO94916.1 50S ribosomal protein L28 [Elusimicrobiales bacterium]
MAYKCKICGKSAKSGKSYSHSNKASIRKFKPNLQKQKIVLDGKTTTCYVCTTCIKSNRIVKAI